MAKKQTKVPVTSRALIQRINRALKDRGEMVRTARGERALLDLGQFYVIDVSANCVMAKDIDLEQWGRDLEALKPFEALAEET